MIKFKLRIIVLELIAKDGIMIDPSVIIETLQKKIQETKEKIQTTRSQTAAMLEDIEKLKKTTPPPSYETSPSEQKSNSELELNTFNNAQAQKEREAMQAELQQLKQEKESLASMNQHLQNENGQLKEQNQTAEDKLSKLNEIAVVATKVINNKKPKRD